MKKFVIHLFTLIFIILVVCTFASVFVEEQMTPRVQTTSATEAKEGHQTVIPIDAVKFTDNGSVFYRIEAGTGWDTGDFVSFDQANIMGVEDGKYLCNAQPYTKYVLYFSKPIYDGQEVFRMTGTESHEADILVILESDEFLSDAFEGETYSLVENFGDGHILIRDKSSREYFFKEKIVSHFEQYGIMVNDAVRLEDFAQLMRNLPLVALLALMLGVMVIFWALFFRGIYGRKLKKTLISIAGEIAAFGVFFLLIKIIELPSALLPERAILDFAHYRQQTELITNTLKTIGDEATMRIYHVNLYLSMAILVLAVVAVLAALAILVIHKRDPKPETAVKAYAPKPQAKAKGKTNYRTNSKSNNYQPRHFRK